MPKRFWATWPITTFVLSPSVETTTASASSIPASRRTALSMPWPRTNPPVQFSPRRLRADSLSSTAVTSHPSAANRFAIVEPTRVGTGLLCLLDDGLPDRAGPDRLPVHIDTVVCPEQLRLGERRLGPLLLVEQLRVDRKLHRNPDDVESLDRGSPFLCELDRRGDHLLADVAQL